MSTKSSNCTKLEATARPDRQRRKVRAGAASASGIWGILGHSREVVPSSLPPPHNRSPLQLLLGPACVLWCICSLSAILQFQYISPLQLWLGLGLSRPPTIPPPPPPVHFGATSFNLKCIALHRLTLKKHLKLIFTKYKELYLLRSARLQYTIHFTFWNPMNFKSIQQNPH